MSKQTGTPEKSRIRCQQCGDDLKSTVQGEWKVVGSNYCSCQECINIINFCLTGDITIEKILLYFSKHMYTVDYNVLNAIGSYLISIQDAPFIIFLNESIAHNRTVSYLLKFLYDDITPHDSIKGLGALTFIHLVFRKNTFYTLQIKDQLYLIRTRCDVYNVDMPYYWVCRQRVLTLIPFRRLAICIALRKIERSKTTMDTAEQLAQEFKNNKLTYCSCITENVMTQLLTSVNAAYRVYVSLDENNIHLFHENYVKEATAIKVKKESIHEASSSIVSSDAIPKDVTDSSPKGLFR